MNLLRICLFGRFHVQYGEQILTEQIPPRLQQFFSYLLLYQDRSHSREALASQFWSNNSTSQSKKYLRQALWQLQTALYDQTGADLSPVLLVDQDRVQINPQIPLWLDLVEFERAFSQAQGVSGRVLDRPRVQALQNAVALYQGDLLVGWFQDWCLFERERFQNMYLSVLDKLMDHCEEIGDYEAGLAYGHRVLRVDQAREATHRRLMRLYFLSGNRTAALRQYEHCVQALVRELAVPPAPRTKALYEQIRTGQMDGSRQSAPARSARPASTTSPSELVQYLKAMQATLADVQDQLQRTIQVAELAPRE